MVFPVTPLAATVEIFVAGAWVDVTAYCFVRDSIDIKRGHADEGSRPDPASAALTVNNIDGRFSPRNPTGPYYGQIGRNTPLRVSVREGTTYLACPGNTVANTGASTPDAAALDIVGDIDIRVDCRLDNWVTSGTANSVELAGKFTITGNQRSWILMMRNGRPHFEWSTAGTAATVTSVDATDDPPIPPSRRLAIRVTLDVNVGGSAWEATFYTAPSLSGPWTQLGNTLSLGGVTSIFNSTAVLRVGDGSGDLGFYSCNGQVLGFELRNGIGGSAVANPDFTAQTSGASSFADGTGKTWTVGTGTTITNRRVRFVGEVPSWPSRWEISGKDVWVPLEAAGIFRRLGQGASPLASTLRRGITSATATVPPVAYWPCEDAESASAIASGIGGQPMTITGTPTLASYEGFPASSPLPVMADGSFSGRIPAYTVTGQTQVRWLLAVPAGGAVAGQTLMRWTCTGSAVKWELQYGTGGTLKLLAYDSDGTTLLDSGAIAFTVNGLLLRVHVGLTQSGSNINWEITVLSATTGLATSSTGTLNSQTVGRVNSLWAAPDRGLTNTSIGHISVQASVTSLFDLGGETAAWQQEEAATRVARLCAENSIAYAVTGGGTLLGAQRPDALLALLGDAADADGGVLTELRAQLGIGYAHRAGRYNQPVQLALDYAASQLSPPLEPADDDAEVRNDVTVQRTGGSSSRAQLLTGALSVNAPPSGVGRYDEQFTLNLARDLDTADQARWAVYLGTRDELRFPTITVDLSRNPSLITSVAELEPGARITIANPPAWLPPELIDLILLGYAETLEPFGWMWTANCLPARPYDVAVYGTARYGSAGSTLASSYASGATSLSVATSAGPLWTTAGGDVPFDVIVAGERMTVTAISGASSPQTFTVTRSVNGVVKAQTSGAAVALYQPAIRAL